MHNLAARAARYWPIVRLLLVVGGVLSVLIALVHWGGTARPGPLFVLGVALLSGLILSFGLIVAWVFSAPPPVAQPLSAERADLRATIAVLTVISSGCFVVGGTWDELWHRRYGGFGDDFLWPPHLTIYVSIALFMGFALLGLRLALRGQGSLRTRFRAEAQLGLIGLISTFLLISLPSDEIWHRIYGKDITAWSLPHIVATVGGLFVTLGGASLALSLLPRPARWSSLRGLALPELMALLLLGLSAITMLQVGTTEWEGLRVVRPGSDPFQAAFWQRPQWLYPVVVLSIGVFFATCALHLLRRYGAASFVALFAVLFRLLCLSIFSDSDRGFGLGYTSHLLLLVPALVLDGWYLLQRGQAERLRTLIGGNLLAYGAFLLLGLPLIGRMLIYPPINSYTVPRVMLVGLLMALASGWAGARLGGWLAALDRSPVQLRPRPRALVFVLSGGSLAILIVVVMLLTAHALGSVNLG